MAFDKAKFFDHVRKTLFGGRLSAQQVQGIEAILDAGASLGTARLAYVLATAYHETGQSMFPNRENLNYSVRGLMGTFGRHRISTADASKLGRKTGEGALSEDRQAAIANIIYGGEWGKENLGNTQPNDGWHFRGGGMDHITGRRNWRKVADAVGLGDALMIDPNKILDPVIAAKAIVTGMQSGRYTTHKLADYLPATGTVTSAAFVPARAIINGRDRAEDIANHAKNWQAGLIAAGR